MSRLLLSVHEDDVEIADALGVRDQVDVDDLAVCDRQAEHTLKPSARSPDDAGRSVDDGSLEPVRPFREPRGDGDGALSHRLGFAASDRGGVGPDDNVGIEQAQEGVKVARTGGREKRFGNPQPAGVVEGGIVIRDLQAAPGRLAICRAAPDDRPTIGPISSNGIAKIS